MGKQLQGLVVLVAAFGLGCVIGRRGVAPQGSPVAIAPGGATQDNLSVFFSPKGGCTAAVVGELDNAKKTVMVQAYSFTSKPITDALIRAKSRGVAVTLVVDRDQRQERYSKAPEVAAAGIATFADGKHAIAHNKIMLIDGTTIITGSFNFTNQAENSNAENLLIIKDKAGLYTAYEKNFKSHLDHSDKW